MSGTVIQRRWAVPPGQVPRQWHRNGGTRTAATAGQCPTCNSRNECTARGDQSICREGAGRRQRVTPVSINITFSFHRPPIAAMVAPVLPPGLL